MVRVIQGATTLNAIPIYVSATRIDAIMPSNVPLGMVSIQAANGAVRGNMAPARVTDASFGISTANTIGIGPGQFMNLNDDGSTTQNTAASPAYIVSRLGGGHSHRPSCLCRAPGLKLHLDDQHQYEHGHPYDSDEEADARYDFPALKSFPRGCPTRKAQLGRSER